MYTYLALTQYGTPLAAYPRKYEMVWFLKQQPEDTRKTFMLYRLRGSDPVVKVDLEYYGL